MIQHCPNTCFAADACILKNCVSYLSCRDTVSTVIQNPTSSLGHLLFSVLMVCSNLSSISLDKQDVKLKIFRLEDNNIYTSVHSVGCYAYCRRHNNDS